MMAMPMTGTERHFVPAIFLALSICAAEAVLAQKHRVDFAGRVRYSDLQDGGNDGEASSLLIRASLQSSWRTNFHTYIEFDHVENGLEDEHSDGIRFNGKPTIPDVPGSEINQFFARFFLQDWDIIFGRQVIELGNQRFIGSVNFWQNEQTFDSAFIEKAIFTSSKINYGYVWNSNRIFGDDADSELSLSDINYGELGGQRPVARLGDHEHETHILRLEINEWDYSTLALYSYLIDNIDAPATSNNTLGASYLIKIKPEFLQYRFEAETAIQRRPEIANKTTLSYFRLDTGIGFRSAEMSLRYESLGAKDGVAFFTPLGSLHEFHGWADQFGAPPPKGLEDLSLRFTWRKAPWKVDFRYHLFESNAGSQDFGEELDFDIIVRPAKKHNIMLRFADFKASNKNRAYEDTRRIFLSYSYNL